jgi:hypothetical protein
MPFLFICNPLHGDLAGQLEQLFTGVIREVLMEYDNWTPALQVQRETHSGEISEFLDRYEQFEVAVVYNGLPASTKAQPLLSDEGIVHHIFLDHRVDAEYISSIAESKRVMISDPFHRQARNSDYPEREFFTDMNTLTGNPRRLDFGDFSIVGDHYADTGGPAYAVALHHVHFQAGPGPLDISHFVSDKIQTPADTPGKIIEALARLVDALDDLQPNNTQACTEYREMAAAEVSRGLGYMKRLAIKHHLEVMLDGGIRL